VESALSGERYIILSYLIYLVSGRPPSLPHRLASRQIGPAARPPGRKIRAGHPRPSGQPAGRLAARLVTRCQRPARLKFGPARMGPALGRAASQGGRGAGRAAGQPAGPAIQVCELSGGYLCLRLAGWQSERPAGRPATPKSGRPPREKRLAGRPARPGQAAGQARPSCRPGGRPPGPHHSVECAGTSKSGSRGFLILSPFFLPGACKKHFSCRPVALRRPPQAHQRPRPVKATT